MNKRLLVLLFVSFILLIYNLGSWGLTETSEARYAEISKEMMVNKNYLHPTLLDIHHYHKPPITYYITVLGYQIFGVNEFGARFFLQVAIIIQLFLIYKITFILYKNENLSLAATIIYFSLPIVLISSRNLTTDAYLNTFILTSIYFWLLYKFKDKRRIFQYLFYIFLGLSVATKGPVALLFPLLFIICYKLIFNKKLFSLSRHNLFGLFIFFIIASFWEIVLTIESGKVLGYFVKDQLLERIQHNSYNRSEPFWYYFAFIPLIGSPWFLFLMDSIRDKSFSVLKNKQFEYLLLSTIVVLILIFSAFKTKLILYLLPVFGFVSILAAKLLIDATKERIKFYNIFIIALISLILISVLSLNLFNTRFHYNFWTAFIITSLVVVSLILINRHHFTFIYQKTISLSYLFSATILILGAHFLMQNDNQVNSIKHVIEFIDRNPKSDKQVVVYNYLLPSAEFYTGKKIITLNNGHNTVQRETLFEKNDD